MAEKSVKTTVVSLDPMFYIPEGVDELTYNSEEQNREFLVPTEDYAGTDFAGDGNEGEFIIENEFNYPDGPDTPDILEVVSQTLRRSPTGHQVVDIVLEVSDVEGVASYEFRVSKI